MPLPTTDLTGHWDSSDTDNLWKETGMSTHPADGDAVLAWNDEGDNSYTNAALFTYAGSSTNVPVYRAGAFPTVSLGCLDFDGADDRLACFTDAWGPFVGLNNYFGASAFTLFVSFVMEGASGTNAAASYNNTALFCDAFGQFIGLHVKSNAGVHTLMGYCWDGADKHADLTFALNTPYVAMFRYGSGTITLDLNNSGSPVTASAAPINTSGAWWIGQGSVGGSYFNGKIGEIAMYSSALSSSPLQQAWDYFNVKWRGVSGGGGGKRWALVSNGLVGSGLVGSGLVR
jgi:hypothetical protein